ncbi:UNVERIFIED_CONTAM: hypothetical protein Sradi_4786600 [Sesamum radiatum]|uniref:Uncharacterized protein n=1 Tax=Sesamum radiatum TaxID=300843 RepID=A0AAW2MVR1_SESRA
MEEVLEEPSSAETSEIPNTLQKQERDEVLKAVWCHIQGLDATIKIPLLLFFKQTVKVAKSLPAYYLLLNDYIFHGKLKEAINKHILESVEGIKNMDYSDVAKDLQRWMVERYLDFIELIWPFYCRTLRFLKRANLI